MGEMMKQFRDESGQFVSLREYIEVILRERQKAHQVEHELIEKALDKAQILREEALAQARNVVDQRLEKLNELRSEVQEDRSQFLRLDTYESKHEILEREVKNVAEAGRDAREAIREEFLNYARNEEEKRLAREEEIRKSAIKREEDEKGRRRATTYTLISFGLTIIGLTIMVLTK